MLLSGPRRLAALLLALATALLGLAVLAQPASAAPAAARKAPGGSAPGSFTGYAFDTCATPAQSVMDAWWTSSPYAGVGVYMGGANQLCDESQLTAGWVQTQLARGWSVLPLWVGPQAACARYPSVMSYDFATATQQGRAEAASAVATAQSLGLGSGATLYYDLEDYDITSTPCRQAALWFMSGWTSQLHAAGYRSGVYSNISAAITSLDLADRVSNGTYEMPDDIWFAWANGQADSVTDSRVLSDRWDDHARIHQYVLDQPQTWGGVTLTVDANWVDVGQGSVGTKSKPLCRGVQTDLRRYPVLKPGKRGPVVEAAQCLLRRAKVTRAPLTGRYDARTVAAVKKAQRKAGLRPTGRLTRPTWAALQARGSQPLLKVGSTGELVLRLQRALGASLGKRVAVTGVVDQATEAKVRRLQAKAGLAQTGVVTTEVWDELSGRG